MRWSIIRTIFGKELREMLRDRRSMMVMFGIPLILYPLLTIAVAGIGTNKAKEMQERPVRVLIENIADAPELASRLADPKKFTVFTPADLEGKNATALLGSEDLDALLTVPHDAQHDALSGNKIKFVITLDRSKTFADYADRRLHQVLSDYERWLIEQRLAKRDVPADVLTGIATDIKDVARAEQRFGHLLAQMIPMLLLITGTLGALFPALNATTMEKENGTLEALLVTPASRLEILIAKGILVFATGLLTAALNMISMSAVLWRVTSLAAAEFGGKNGLFNIDPGALVLSFIAAIPALIFFTSLVLIVGLIARNYREANSFVTPVMLLPMASIFVSIAEPPSTLQLMLIPVVSTTLIIRDVLVGHVNWEFFSVAFATSCIYAGLMLSLATRIFSTEQLVNPSWEPVSIRGLRGSFGKPFRRWPTVDEAFALFAIGLILQLYIGPSIQGRMHPLAGIFAVQIFLVALPPLILAWLGRYNWAEVFKFRMPRLREITGTVLIGFGLVFVVSLISAWQNYYWPDHSDMNRMQAELLIPLLEQHPLLTILGMGFLAGVGEEIYFRGVIQTAFARRVPVWLAIAITALLFAAAHMHLNGMPIRFALGIVLGWVFWRSGSMIPAMLLHWAYDSGALAYAKWELTRQGAEALTQSSQAPHFSWLYVAGAVMVTAGALVLIATKRGKRPIFIQN